MNDFILLTIIILLIIVAVFRTFEPHIDIIQTGVNSYRILLWYNYFDGPAIDRRYIKLYEGRRDKK